MKKNITIISSIKSPNKSFLSLLENLSEFYDFSLLGKDGSLFDFFREKKWKRRRVFLYKNLFYLNGFYIFLYKLLKPFIQVLAFLKLSILKYRNKNRVLFMLGLNEKLILSPIAKILKLNYFWLETSDVEYRDLNRGIQKKFANLANKSKIICFNDLLSSKIQNLGVGTDRIKVIYPGIKIMENRYQENIFSNIAKHENNQIGKKFFTIGAITELDDKFKIENLFSALKNSIDFIPRTQLIIVGNGPFSPDKNPWAKWLAKKMGIDTMVWFIADESKIKKWLDSFDVFVISSKKLNLDDFKTTLLAMEAGLAPLVPSDIGFEELIKDGQNGYYYDQKNIRTLSDNIIKYYKNKRLVESLSKNAKKTVYEGFRLEASIEEFKKII